MTRSALSFDFALSEIIYKKSLDDRTTNVFVYGEPRIGKSVYCIKVLKELCRARGFPDDYWKKLVLFKPKMLIEAIKYIRVSKEKAPGLILDDFGLWGFAWDWTDPDLKSAIKILQVAGTLTDTAMITAPSTQMAVKKVLTLEGMLVGKVVKSTGNPLQNDLRSITLYRNGLAPWGKRYINTACEDNFSVKLSDEDYAFYKPMREAYVDDARKQMELALRG